MGFTKTVEESGTGGNRRADIPVVAADLGSGFGGFKSIWLPKEPMPQHFIAAGVSPASFSGDKLLAAAGRDHRHKKR